MFSIIAKFLAFVSFLVLVVATPVPAPSSGTSQCNTGPVQCCTSVQNAGDGNMPSLMGLLGIVVGANVPIGLDCSPISVIGQGTGANCKANPVCCDDNSSGGLASVGCIPISLDF